MKVCIYCRVSKSDMNVEQQVQYCKNYCKSRDWDVIWTIKDKESGTLELEQRESFKKLLYTVSGGTDTKNRYNFMDQCDIVLIYRLDRLTRNWDNVAIIEKAFLDSKWNLYSASDSEIDLKAAEGRFKFRLMMALAVREVELMKERQKIGIERAQAEGKFKGRPKGSKNKVTK